MSEFQPFRCGECGNTVELTTGIGRTREYVTGYHVPVPDDFSIPTCAACGEIYVLPDIEEKLNPILRKAFLRMQSQHYRELVSILTARHCVTQRDIVRACAVTASYLSHVMAGKRQASITLTRLLEAFVADRSEFERHLGERPWALPGFLRAAATRPADYAATAKWRPTIANSNGSVDDKESLEHAA